MFRTHGISSTDTDTPEKEYKNDAFCLKLFDTSDASLISISHTVSFIHSENTQKILNLILWLMFHSSFTNMIDSY